MGVVQARVRNPLEEESALRGSGAASPLERRIGVFPKNGISKLAAYRLSQPYLNKERE
jgi:hypothetical protein